MSADGKQTVLIAALAGSKANGTVPQIQKFEIALQHDDCSGNLRRLSWLAAVQRQPLHQVVARVARRGYRTRPCERNTWTGAATGLHASHGLLAIS